MILKCPLNPFLDDPLPRRCKGTRMAVDEVRRKGDDMVIIYVIHLVHETELEVAYGNGTKILAGRAPFRLRDSKTIVFEAFRSVGPRMENLELL